MNTASQVHARTVDIARSKLPEITLAFWIMKICATTLGETAGDLLSMTLKIGYAASSVLLVGIFLVTLGAQLRSRAYHPLLYWTVILSTSTAATTLSDSHGPHARPRLLQPARRPSPACSVRC